MTPLAGLRFGQHVAGCRWAHLPVAVVDAAKVFILDTLGVGVAGSTAAGAAALQRCGAGWGGPPEAAVWGTRLRLPAGSAALTNGFQVHCQEYDCVHEGAVLHPMATLLPAALAWADRAGGVSGRDLITAVAAGVDVSSGLGVASRSPLRFFRPAAAGGFGAAAAVAWLAGLDAEGVLTAFGLQYAQSSGTMQPHVEGSVALPMQVGFNSRAGIGAVDLVQAGLSGPRDVFEGPYGFLRLFEGEWELGPVLDGLGRAWQVAALSHKPFPAGRATHGAIEGVMALREAHGFDAGDVASIVLEGPPIIRRLCGRTPHAGMSANFGRLSTGFAVANVLRHGELDLSHYRGAALHDPATLELAKVVSVVDSDVTDPNALGPQRLVVRLRDGRSLAWACETMLASPARPLSRAAHLRKFRRCWSFAAEALGPAEAVIELVDGLEHVSDVRALTALLQPA